MKLGIVGFLYFFEINFYILMKLGFVNFLSLF